MGASGVKNSILRIFDTLQKGFTKKETFILSQKS
jgi:hypothetical protein